MNEPGLDLSVPMGVSGAFLCDKPRFSEIRQLCAEFYRLNSQLGEIEFKLCRCNDPQWLASSFESRCRRLSLDPERELIVQAGTLQTKKAALAKQMDEVRQKLLALEPTALNVHHTLAGASTLYPHSLPILLPRRERDLSVEARNKVIDGVLHLPYNLAICKALDDEFPPTEERPAPQFPDRWFREFGIKSFVEAYNKCPHLVHTLIWRRRKRRSP